MAESGLLVVDTIERQRGKIAFLLRAAGYRVDVADGFEHARERIARCEPSCIVTGVRLGLYNGLHLIARARRLHPSMASVLTHNFADPVLQSEARSSDTAFLVLPCPGEVLVNLVRHSILRASKSSGQSFSQRKVGSGEDSNEPAAPGRFTLNTDPPAV